MMGEAVPLQVSLVSSGILLYVMSLFLVGRIFTMVKKHEWLRMGKKNIVVWLGLSAMIVAFAVSLLIDTFFAMSSISVYSLLIYPKVFALSIAVFVFVVMYMQYDFYKQLTSIEQKGGYG